MLIAEEKFYHEALDPSIPALKDAIDRYDAGDKAGAASAFAAYFKTVLRPDLYLTGRQSESPAPSDRDTAVARADRICEGEVVSTGFPYVFKDNVFDWEVNPTFNEYKEWTWQLSRHPEFVRLAEAYSYTKDEKYARQYDRMIVSWIEQCTCPENASGYATKTWRTIEAGIRMLGNWHVAIHTFMNSPSVSDADWVLIFRSVYEHVYRLRGFRTSHNWLIMEMGGLVNIAVLYPFFRDADEWFRDGMDTLLAELDIQLYPDDFQYELTTGYHGVNIGNYENVISLCRKYGVEVPAAFLNGVYRMYRFYTKAARPDLLTPALNDGGTVNVPAMLGKALLSYPDDEVFRWFATKRAEGKAPDFDSVVLEYSGQVVMRQSWEPDAVWALFDGGPFGYAHQHEDKLNFILYAYGEDMLPDPGNYAYDTSKQRAYILSTRSHNTGLVDGLGQNRREIYHWEPEDIKKKAESLVYRNGPDFETAECTYSDGYGSRRCTEDGKSSFVPASHRRKIVFFKKGWKSLPPFFVLLDDFTAETGSHTFEVSFQLTGDPAVLSQNGVQVSFPSGASLVITSDVYPTAAVGQYAPEYKGWQSIHAQGEHEHQPAPLVSFPKVGASASFATVVLPLPHSDAPALRVSRTADSFTLTCGNDSETFPVLL